MQLHSYIPAHRGIAEGPQHKGQANLHRVVEAARVEASERGDLVQPVAEGIAVDREPVGVSADRRR